MDTVVLPATRRKVVGSKHSQRLRQHGQLPAIVYGHGERPEAIALQAHDVEVALLHHSRLVQLDVEGTKQQYLIKAVQYDHLGTTPIHVDLMRVSMDERVTVQVTIELKGTPKGAAEGGHLDQLMDAVEVECLVTAIPESFRANVNNLGIGDAVSVGDIELPPGVKLLTDPEEKIAICREPTVAREVEEEEIEAVEGEAEPEVIGREKEEESEGES
jgi:large subunit ribosomal protein L25